MISPEANAAPLEQSLTQNDMFVRVTQTPHNADELRSTSTVWGWQRTSTLQSLEVVYVYEGAVVSHVTLFDRLCA